MKKISIIGLLAIASFSSYAAPIPFTNIDNNFTSISMEQKLKTIQKSNISLLPIVTYKSVILLKNGFSNGKELYSFLNDNNIKPINIVSYGLDDENDLVTSSQISTFTIGSYQEELDYFEVEQNGKFLGYYLIVSSLTQKQISKLKQNSKVDLVDVTKDPKVFSAISRTMNVDLIKSTHQARDFDAGILLFQRLSQQYQTGNRSVNK